MRQCALFTDTTKYHIMYRIKVTAIIADDLVNTVKEYTQSSTVTEAITIVLKDWIDLYNIKELNRQIEQNPISIKNGQKMRTKVQGHFPAALLTDNCL